MNNATSRETYQKSTAEHERLLAGADGLLAEWPRDTRKAAELQPWLVAALNEFRSKLKLHFAAEETPDYLSDAVAAAPRLAYRAQELQQQHAEFLATLERLSASVENKGLTGDQLAAERDVLRTLICNLRRHEQAEDDLLLAAFDDDLGSGD